MSDVILAVLGRQERAQGVLDAAHHLSTLIGKANVIALAVGMPPLTHPLGAEALIAEAADAETLHQRDRDRTASLRSLFDKWAIGVREAGIQVQWRKVAGAASEVVEQIGRRADFLVIAQPLPDDDAHTRSGFQAALLHSDRPVLVVPPDLKGTFGTSVAIAWRDDGRVIKAAMPALRWVTGTARIHVLRGTRNPEDSLTAPAVFSEHGINVELHVLPIRANFGQTLLDNAHALGADMLVMGAYAHSPLREMIFGGVTRYMLEHADLPVLMCH